MSKEEYMDIRTLSDILGAYDGTLRPVLDRPEFNPFRKMLREEHVQRKPRVAYKTSNTFWLLLRDYFIMRRNKRMVDNICKMF